MIMYTENFDLNAFLNSIDEGAVTIGENNNGFSTPPPLPPVNDYKNNPATNPMKKYYRDLCVQKGVTPVSDEELTYIYTKTKIEELKAMKKVIPVTPAQIDRINKLITALEMPPINTDKLTGGREGTASATIQRLIKMNEERSKKMPPSEAQLNHIKKMSLCPDVELFEGTTMAEAKEYIQKYKVTYNGWFTTRLSIEQGKFIQSLQKQLGNEIFTDLQLLQFSHSGAKKYIDQLCKEKAELNEKREGSTLEKEIEDTTCRNVLDSTKINKQQYDEFIACVHTLYASIGQEAEDLVLNTSEKLITIAENKDPHDGELIKHYQSELKMRFNELIMFVGLFVNKENIAEMCGNLLTKHELDTLLPE